MVRSRLARGGLAEARAAGAQHKEYMSVRVALANEATLRHGKARRRYTSPRVGAHSEVERPATMCEHFAPSGPPAASAPCEHKLSADVWSWARSSVTAS